MADARGTASAPVDIPELDAKQESYARAIIARIKARKLPRRAAYVAFATVFQESGFRMYANEYNPQSLTLPHDAVGSDHGSVGLFQQQVGGATNSTANWGTTRELMTVSTSTDKFLDRLVSIGGWQSQGIGQAAQEVQGSAFPDAYAAHESKSIRIVDQLWDSTPTNYKTTSGASGITTGAKGALGGAVGGIVGGGNLLTELASLLTGLFSGGSSGLASGAAGVVGEDGTDVPSYNGPPPPFEPNTVTVPLGAKREAVVTWLSGWAAHKAGTVGTTGGDVEVAAWRTFYTNSPDEYLQYAYNSQYADYQSDATGNQGKPTARSQVNVTYTLLGRVLLFVGGIVVVWFSIKQIVSN